MVFETILAPQKGLRHVIDLVDLDVGGQPLVTNEMQRELPGSGSQIGNSLPWADSERPDLGLHEVAIRRRRREQLHSEAAITAQQVVPPEAATVDTHPGASLSLRFGAPRELSQWRE